MGFFIHSAPRVAAQGGPLAPVDVVIQPTAPVLNPADFLTQRVTPAGDLWVIDQPTTFTAETEEAPVRQMRHDWPGSNVGAEGWQASASYATGDGRFVATYNFAPWTAFNQANGDGGEVYAVHNGLVTITETQDGGLPTVQHFTGTTGWIAFDVNHLDNTWHSAVAKLWNDTSGPYVSDVDAFTRWTLQTIETPFIIDGVKTERLLPTIVSEHYSGTSIETATAMERTFFGLGVGRERWEAWTTGAPAGNDLDLRAPDMAFSVAPEPGWSLSDVRTLTNIQELPHPWTAPDYGWIF